MGLIHVFYHSGATGLTVRWSSEAPFLASVGVLGHLPGPALPLLTGGAIQSVVFVATMLSSRVTARASVSAPMIFDTEASREFLMRP